MRRSYRGRVNQVEQLAPTSKAPSWGREGGARAATEPFVVMPRQAGLRYLFAEFWRYRLLMPYFGTRYLQKRFARTWLGMIWLPLRPGVNLALRILVFGGLVGISTGTTPYPIFFIVATAAWQLFYESAYWSMRSIDVNRRLLSRVYVPRLVVIGSALLPAFVDFCVNIMFVALAVLYYVFRAHVFYLELSVRTLLVPLGLAMMILLGLGVGLLASGVGARSRDLRFGIRYFFQFAYYLTPVIYPLTAIPQKARPFAELNPMTGAVEMVKDGLFRAHELSPDAVYVTLFWVFLIWVPGLWLFDRSQVGVLHGRRLVPGLRRQATVATGQDD
jgi:lipopolysaccharide transport system permease protein